MVHMIGNAHIDPVWLWDWREGYQEIKATFQSALDRLDETDEFVFTAACAGYYQWVQENAPDMFEKIKARVAEGRWHIVGGMWIQPDCNMPSGESFARQLLYSQRFFQENLGVTVKTGYNVDSFGHSGNLPALFTRAGIENYIFQRPGVHENDKIPGPLFRWVAPDGSSVTTYRIDGYGTRGGDVSENIAKTVELEEKIGYPLLCFYGVGNHGGGPTVKNIASIRDYQKNGKKGTEVIFSDPDTYFDEIKKLNLDLPVWDFELQHHASGCYSATSLIKRLNRRTENALLRCEFFTALADKLTGHKAKPLTQGWQNLMFNQFHDVMCGCSIREAYDDAESQLREAINIAAREENAALQKISWRVDTVGGIPGRIRSKECHFRLWQLNNLGTPVVVFNPHPFEVETPVQIFGVLARATDENDVEIPMQIVRASRTNGEDKWDSLFMAKVPALGYRLYWVYLGEQNPDQKKPTPTPEIKTVESELEVTETSIENSKLVARFDRDTGALISLKRKDNGLEALKAPALPRLVDVEHIDTWAHMVFKFDKLKESFQNGVFQILETGPVRAKLRVTTSTLGSKLIQDYTLYAGSDQLEVSARVDLQEKFRMLKLCFPVAATNPKAYAEISYAAIERPLDGCEEHGHRWMDVSGDEGGLGVLNDSKYSFSAVDGELRLTVANTSIFADHYGQQNRDNLVRHADIGEQEFQYALVPHTGCWRCAGLPRRGEVFNRPLTHIVETYHEGDLPVKYEGLKVSAANVSVGAVKRAEDGGAYVLRVVETMGKQTEATLDAPMFGRTIAVSLKPWDIKTVVVPDDPNLPTRETLFTEW